MKTAKVLITLLVISFIVFNFIPVNVKAGPYDDWPYYLRIFVTENSGQDLRNYPLKVRIDWQPGMKSDFSDLRFTYINSTTYEETPICYWIEGYNEYEYVDVWIFIPYLPANGTVEIKAYYGNSLAQSQSNYDCVFQGILLLEDNFTTDHGWTNETVGNYWEHYLDTTNGCFVLNMTNDAVAGDYDYIVKSLTVPYDGWLNISLTYDWYSGKASGDPKAKVFADTSEVYSKDLPIAEGTFETYSTTVKADIKEGTRNIKIGFYYASGTTSGTVQTMYVKYVKVRLIPQVSPAPSYGIVYMEPSEYISLEPVTVSIGEANVTGVSFGALDLPSAFYVAAAYEIGKYMLFAVPIIFLLIGSRRLSAISIFIACGLALLINHATGTVFFNEQVVGVVAFIGVLALFAEESKHRR